MPNIMLILKRLYLMQIPLLGRCLSHEFLDFVMKFDLTDKQNIMFSSFHYRAVLYEVMISLHFQ